MRGWRDLGLQITGPFALELAESFDVMYGRADFRHRRFQRLQRARDRITTGQNWQLLSSGPGRRHGELTANASASSGGGAELECSLPMDRVRAVEKLDLSPIGDPQLCVETADLGVFVGDPFIGRHGVVVPALNHERARSDQRRHLAVIEGVPRSNSGISYSPVNR